MADDGMHVDHPALGDAATAPTAAPQQHTGASGSGSSGAVIPQVTKSLAFLHHTSDAAHKSHPTPADISTNQLIAVNAALKQFVPLLKLPQHADPLDLLIIKLWVNHADTANFMSVDTADWLQPAVPKQFITSLVNAAGEQIGWEAKQGAMQHAHNTMLHMQQKALLASSSHPTLPAAAPHTGNTVAQNTAEQQMAHLRTIFHAMPQQNWTAAEQLTTIKNALALSNSATAAGHTAAPAARGRGDGTAASAGAPALLPKAIKLAAFLPGSDRRKRHKLTAVQGDDGALQFIDDSDSTATLTLSEYTRCSIAANTSVYAHIADAHRALYMDVIAKWDEGYGAANLIAYDQEMRQRFTDDPKDELARRSRHLRASEGARGAYAREPTLRRGHNLHASHLALRM